MKKHIFFLVFGLCSLSAAAQNVKGYIRSSNKGVPGVVVSDGDSVTVTDENGYYALQSNKRNGYVFYTLPRGYEPTLQDGFRPQFWQALKYSVNLSETHSFTITKRDNDDYSMVIGADSHLANRTSDLAQFKAGYMECLKAEKKAAGTGRIYSMILGDLSWDNFWYARNFDLEDFMSKCKEYGYPMTLWPVIGNHDNDGATLAGENCDFLASGPWRSIVCPNYYSFNLGRVHYVVLDDIYYKNEDTGGSYSKGIVGSRNYTNHITPDQFEWLKRDLAYVEDKTAPLVIAVHIPVWKINTASPYDTKANLTSDDSQTLAKIVKDFKNVHIISGHTHINYHAHPAGYPNIMEHNIAAICATWWWTGHVSGHHVCKDGTPGGYSFWQVQGDKLQWKYKSIEQNGDLQMRIYDMNTVKEYFAKNDSALTMLAKYPERTTYSEFMPNRVVINVFAYDTDWKITVYEGTARRSAIRFYGEDPFHTISYDVPRVIQNGDYTQDWVAGKTSHLFQVTTVSSTTPVTVRLTDSFGNVYSQTIQRPHPFCLDMEKLQKDEEPAGLPTITTKGEKDTYDLAGRRVYAPRRGVYVQGGRKVLHK